MARLPAVPVPPGYYPVKLRRDDWLLLIVSQSDEGEVTSLATPYDEQGHAVRFRTKAAATLGAIECDRIERARREEHMQQRIRELETALRATQKGVS